MKNGMKIIRVQGHAHLSSSFQLIQVTVFFLFYSELENYSLHKNCDFPQAALFDFSTTESSQTEG